jgi:hypothetical protein
MSLVSRVFPLREASLRRRLLSLRSRVLNHIMYLACHLLPGYYIQDVTRKSLHPLHTSRENIELLLFVDVLAVCTFVSIRTQGAYPAIAYYF